MSHDRKPGRVRVLKTGAGSAQRRRKDQPAIDHVGTSAALAQKSARGRGMVLAILFLLAAIGCAVVTELYLPA